MKIFSRRLVPRMALFVFMRLQMWWTSVIGHWRLVVSLTTCPFSTILALKIFSLLWARGKSLFTWILNHIPKSHYKSFKFCTRSKIHCQCSKHVAVLTQIFEKKLGRECSFNESDTAKVKAIFSKDWPTSFPSLKIFFISNSLKLPWNFI